MTEADLNYMRMTPAERVAFKLPGTFVFQFQKRKENLAKARKIDQQNRRIGSARGGSAAYIA